MRFVDSGAIALSVPLLYLLGAVAARRPGRSVAVTWRLAYVVATLAVGLSGLAGMRHAWESVVSLGPRAADPGAWVALDLVALAMLGLATTLGWVIIRFSRTYLEGEQEQPRYIAALLTTLASVSTVALSNHLGLTVLGWSATSLSLHQLLTFYRTRPWALIAAHKKFLASRLAELCLAGALLLIGSELGTLNISAITAAVQAGPAASLPLQAGVVLLVLAVIVKSAQLPLHGWLIQVMEAPTPVSALLHAGVVNLGGFVLIRMAPLVSAVPAAQILLVLVGGVTAVLAALVMGTRISVKVKLAWSTCAQMGFMLMECGLGLYELALLHLLAHSIYKAYAFMTAAGAVQDARLHRMAPAAGGLSASRQWIAALAAVAVVAATASAWSGVAAAAQLPWALVFIAGAGIAPAAYRVGFGRWKDQGRALLLVFALAHLPVIWHLLLSNTHLASPQPASYTLLSWTGLCGALLFLVQTHLTANPRGRVSRWLYAWCYAGFYLDERFTRLTFRVWPLRLPLGAGAAPVPAGELAATGGLL